MRSRRWRRAEIVAWVTAGCPARDRWDEIRARLDAEGVPYAGPDIGIPESMYLKDPDGIGLEMLSDPLMFGYCYTQLTDVYQEQNGIYRFDRRAKFDVERIRADFPILKLKVGGKPLVYFDNAASSQMPRHLAH